MLDTLISIFRFLGQDRCFCFSQIRIFAWERSQCRLVYFSASRSHDRVFHRFCLVFRITTCTHRSLSIGQNIVQLTIESEPRSYWHWKAVFHFLWFWLWGLQPPVIIFRSQWFGRQWWTEYYLQGWFCGSWVGSEYGIWIED